jgi:hypothetical protein
LELFNPDFDELGLMDRLGGLKLSAFNIRLNALVSYAAGDRNQTLGKMIANVASSRKDSEYTIPNWLQDMQRGCSKGTRDDINSRSQLFIGKDLCDEKGVLIDYKAKCNEPRTTDMKYCYLTKSPDMIDPRDFDYVGLRRGGSRRRVKRRRATRKRK